MKLKHIHLIKRKRIENEDSSRIQNSTVILAHLLTVVVIIHIGKFQNIFECFYAEFIDFSSALKTR
jgi:hypothetical protein